MQPVFKKVTLAGLNSLQQKMCKNSKWYSWFYQKGWHLRMTWGQEVCYTSLHSESVFALGKPQGWLGVNRWQLCNCVNQILTYKKGSMTSLSTHTVAHCTRPSFRPIVNNQPLKKCLSLAVSWVKVVKCGKILTFKAIFLCQKLSESFKNIFSSKNMILGAHFFIGIFWKLQFLNHFIF